MNETAYQSIVHFLEEHHVDFVAITHEPCTTSEESEAARASAGYPGVIGAKALLAKLYFKTGEQFATIVLPGNHVLNKDALIAGVPDLKKMRFATPEEMRDLAGVVPGCMPPFASPIFPRIPLLIVDTALQDVDRLGFNAAYLEKSIVLPSEQYLSAITPSFLVACSIPKTVEKV